MVGVKFLNTIEFFMEKVQGLLLPLHSIKSIPQNMTQSTKWVFTLNNYTEEDVESLRRLASTVQYLVFGREVAPTTNTPHLQGFLIFHTNQRFNAVSRAIPRSHLGVSRGTPAQASTYCKKENDFEEYGSLPTPKGPKPGVYEVFRDWIISRPTKPTESEVASEFPGLYVRSGRCMRFVDLVFPVVRVLAGEFRAHQQNLYNILEGPPDERKIIFVVDPVGNTGKSWFVRKYESLHDDSQRLWVGRIEDIGHILDPTKRVYFTDAPRSRMPFMQYSVLESIKDGMVASPKYESGWKELTIHPVHVVVFCNEEPDRNQLSADRYKVIHWRTI